MLVKVNSTPRIYFRQLLEFLSPLPPFSSLNNMEKAVFSELLYFSYLSKELNVEDKVNFIFKQNKQKMLFNLGIPKGTFDNQLYTLRKKGLLMGKEINPKYNLSIDSTITINFNLSKDENRR